NPDPGAPATERARSTSAAAMVMSSSGSRSRVPPARRPAPGRKVDYRHFGAAVEGGRAMRMKMTSVHGLAAATLALCLALRAQPDDAIPFPDGYRKWVHVKSTLV